jgi:hypothetical protein
MEGLMEQAGSTQEEMTPKEAMVAGSDPDDMGDEALTKAIEFVGKRLYEANMSTEIAKAFDGSTTAQPKIIASIAYRLAQAADTNTGGEIREENLSVLGILTLNEVITVADAAGMPIDGATASKAMQEMILTYAEDNGLDTTELAQAMGQVDDNEMDMVAQELPDDFDTQLDSIPDEEEEVEQEMAEGEMMS